MRVLRVTAKADSDGCFHLKLPLDRADQLYDVAVVIAPRPPEGAKPTPEELGWPPEFLQNVMGSIDDETFVAPPRLPAKPIEPLDLE
jgi:hypothetical protein